MWTALREAFQVHLTPLQQLQNVSSLWAPMSCEEDLSGNDGKGALPAEISKPAASRADTSSWEGHGWKGRREDEEKQQLGSLPGAKDAVFTHLTGARWTPSPGRRFAWIWRSGFPWEVWMDQAPSPTSELVPGAPREESLRQWKHHTRFMQV